MALPHQTKVYAIKEARVSKMTQDIGGVTYAASVPLTGAKKLAIAGTTKVVYLRGDNRLLDSDSVTDTITAAFDHAKLNLDELAVFWSSGVVDSGITPNQLATFTHFSTDTYGYFKLEARAAGADPLAGDVLIQLWKCKLSGIPSLGLNEEDYQLTNVALVVMPRLVDNRWYDIVERETAVVLT